MTRRLRSPSNHIFALNCLSATRETLKKYSFADRDEELLPRIEEHERELTNATHLWFLHESGLRPLVDDVATPEDLNSAYHDLSQLLSIAQHLDAFLPTATDDARNFLGQLEDKALMRRVVEAAAERFCDDFEEVEGLVIKADEMRAGLGNGEGKEETWLREVFPRTGDEIRVLLS
jgi:conserved oligomeric Golgi complex subunit 6